MAFCGSRTIFSFILLSTVVLCLFADTVAAYGPVWCNNSAVCLNSTHFNLCVGYEHGYVNRWDRPLACPVNSLCNGSRCEEMYSAYPYIQPGAKPCNSYGFVCVTSSEYQACKYDRMNNSVPFGFTFHCPQRTVCDNNYRFHCRDSGISRPQEPLPPPPGWNIPPMSPPIPPGGSNYSQGPAYNGNHSQGGTHSGFTPIRDECKGKMFICLDKRSYMVCELSSDRVIRPRGEQRHCPGKQVCHKTFDRPCVVSGANKLLNSGFSWGFLVTLLLVSIQLL